MYQACRHIKPSGERCKSPAMRDHSFCYFHARVHERTKLVGPRELSFPVPEDFAAIQESIAKVFDGIVNGRIGSKQSSQILRGLQIALQTIPRRPAPPTDSVEFVTLNKKGDELAPPLEVSAPALENASSGMALPSHTGSSSTGLSRIGIDPGRAPGNFRKLENVRVEILGSPNEGQLLIGGEKLLRCLDEPEDHS
jgi:hypothetical protein